MPVRLNGMMTLKYQDDLRECGQVETDEHVLFECNRYGQEQERWRGSIKRLNYDINKTYT